MAQFSTKRNSLLSNNDNTYEVVMLANQVGLEVSASGNTNMGADAFGRARVSTPLTLFDAFVRYDDNGDFWMSTTTGGSTALGSDAASVDLTVDTTSGASAVRESRRVFAYQPGKSLQIFNTFTFAQGQTNLRQRAGYFSTDDGIFLEQDDDVLYFVRRKGGVDTRVAQSDWNIDKVDGTGQSKLILDITKSQIMWMDIEWLGVGTVRCGFVYNGVFVHCHSFHHANSVTEAYMTTACLPVRFEIENTGITTGATLKTICSSVISEGGYTLSGSQYSIGHTITGTGAVGRTLTNAATYYPVLAVRLKDTRKDAIVLPKDITLVPNSTGNDSVINWRVYKGADVTGGTWTSAGTNSSVNYNLTATGFSGGEIITQGFVTTSNQSSQSVGLSGGDVFRYQLERDADSAETFLIAVATNTAADEVAASINWEEIT